MELVFSNRGLDGRQLSDLMAEGSGVAAREWAPTASTVGGLADVQFVDLSDGPEPPCGSQVAWLSVTRAGTQLPHFRPRDWEDHLREAYANWPRSGGAGLAAF